MKWLTLLLLLAVVSLQPGFSIQTQRSRPSTYPIRIYYFNLQANTATAITPQSIEGLYDLTSVLKDKTKEMLAILSQDQGPSKGVDDSIIRLKMVLEDGGVIMLDLVGNVQYRGRKHRISRQSIRDLEKIVIEALPHQSRGCCQ